MRVVKVRLLLAAIAASFLLVPSAEANTTAMKQRYSALYHAVKKRHGSRAPGRNIRKLGIRFDVKADGKAGPWQTRPAKPSEIRTSIRQLRTLLRPARSLLVRRAVPPGQAPAGVLKPSVTGGAVLRRIAQCESGGNPGAVSPSGQYRGLLQFDYQTWQSVGGTGDPAAASAAEQYSRGAMLYARTGPRSWPVCGYR
jgi:soluble lytic murein transglycosylase-like protein